MSYKQFNRIRGLDGCDASWAQTLSRSETHVDLQGLTGRIAFVVDNADEAVAAVVLGLRHHLDMGIVTRDRLTDAVRTALYQAGAHLFDFSQRVLDKVPLTTAHQPGRVFVLTSGTTGVAKLVDHTWQTLNTHPREKALVEEETWFVPYQVGSYAWYQMICLGLFQDGQHIINADANDLVSSFTRNASSITAMSSTPTFWRVINMSVDEAALRSIPIRSISLGGEIVDQALLDRLGSLYPEADIRHIFASTEAGAAIVVKDRRAGFPKAFLDRPQRSASIRWPGINLPAVALDVELKDNKAGAFIRRRYASGDGNFLVRWAMTEVLAKLLDEPVLSLIKRCGLVRESFEWTNASAVLPQHARLEQEAVWLRAIELPDHWAAVGFVDNRK